MCCLCCLSVSLLFFFFNDTATTEIYTLSLHDALPIYPHIVTIHDFGKAGPFYYLLMELVEGVNLDRKSTRLNSSHANISYAVFCLKKKKKNKLPKYFMAKPTQTTIASYGITYIPTLKN